MTEDKVPYFAGDSKSLAPTVIAARDQIQMAIRDLIRASPNEWQFHLAQVVGDEVGVNEKLLLSLLDEVSDIHTLAQQWNREERGEQDEVL